MKEGALRKIFFPKAGASDKSRNDFLVEASIMGQFDHDNVLGLVGVVLEGPRVLILSEFMDKGSLDHYLEASRSFDSESD